MPVRGDVGVQMATGVALAVVAAWLLIPVLVGAWRTRTQDA
jgi:predicted RND superfamily exporter protein